MIPYIFDTDGFINGYLIGMGLVLLAGGMGFMLDITFSFIKNVWK